MDQPDCYAVLGLAEDADEAAVRRAYRRLARDCHPDVRPDDASAAERFLTLAAAYAILGHPARRAAYDGRRRYARAMQAAAPAKAATAHAAFAPLAPAMLAPRRGQDVAAALDLPDSLAARGARLTLDFGVGGPCPVCAGTGELRQACWMCDGRGAIWQPAGPGQAATSCPACNGQGRLGVACPACAGSGRHNRPRRGLLIVPPGARDGDVIRVPGAGQPGVGNAPPGDLVLTLRLFAAPEADTGQVGQAPELDGPSGLCDGQRRPSSGQSNPSPA